MVGRCLQLIPCRFLCIPAFVGCAAVMAMLVPDAGAHPLGNFSVNQYILLNLRGPAPEIYYLLDMAEIPSFPELDLIDVDFDSRVTDEEEANYLKAKVPTLVEKIRFKLSGSPIPLEAVDRRLSLQEGAGKMIVVNVMVKLIPSAKSWPPSELPFDLEIISENYSDNVGVRECKVILGRRLADETKQLGRERLGYQTEIFADPVGNPIYEDFDCQFLIRLGRRAGDDMPSEQIPLGFSWTRTARTSTDSGDNITWGKAFADFGTLEDPTAPDVASSESRALVAEDTIGAPAQRIALETGSGGRLQDPVPTQAAAPRKRSAVVREETGVRTEPQRTAPFTERGPDPKLGEATRDLRPDRGREAAPEGLFGRITDLVRTPDKELTPAMFAVGLAIALVLGMAHARSPGHGKTIMAAYLIGERGTAWNALVLGIVVTITHTWSVLGLGLITLSATQRVSEEQLSFWLGMASGAIIIVIGMVLFARRYRAYLLSRHAPAPDHGHGHNHLPHHHHGPDEAGHHHPGHADHTEAATTAGAPGPSYWHILWLGVSGGIVPCPSALIVLLLSIKFGRLHYGLWLILSFSFGLALVLIVIGLLVVFASGKLREYTGEGGRLLRVLPVFSSAMIALLGVWVVIWTLLQYDVVVFRPGGF